MVEAAEQLNLITSENLGTKILVTIFNQSLITKAENIAAILRKNNISCELYVNAADKLEKQLKYADRKGIPYVIIQGPEEAAKQVVKLKTMATKEQEELSVTDVIQKLSKDN